MEPAESSSYETCNMVCSLYSSLFLLQRCSPRQPLSSVYNVCMSVNTRQYTIRNVPDAVDQALRNRAKRSGKSFNQVVLEALGESAGKPRLPRRDVSFLMGSMDAQEAERMETAVAQQRHIDPELWD